MRSFSLRWTLPPTILVLCALMGCQGFSAPKSSTTTTTTTQTQSAGDLVASNTNSSFGSVATNTSQSQSETLTNTGGSSLTVTQASVTGSEFSITGLTLPLTLDAGQTSSFKIIFTPKVTGSVSGSIALSSDASNPSLMINLSGTGTTTTVPGALSVSSTNLAFGSVPTNTSQSDPETITNTGGLSVNITQATVTGSTFSVNGLTLPLSLNPGQNVTFNAVFNPKTAGAASGSLSITSDASNATLAISLAGTGTTTPGTLTVAPATLDLGSVIVGSSGTASGTLAASGANVTITAASSNSSRFALSGMSLPTTIPAGQQASFIVTFSPQAAGAASGAISFTSNATPSTTTVSLTGTATVPAQHSVSLSWVASTSDDVTGYNIYRATFSTSCGSYVRLNSTLNPSTSYTDSSVTDGATYCYATTAVSSSNEESAYSAVVKVSIPTS